MNATGGARRGRPSRSAVTLFLVAACMLVAACTPETSQAAVPTTGSTLIPRPLVARELASLLLDTDQVNAAMGSGAMEVRHTETSMADNSATMRPLECLALDGAAEADVYADSGFHAEQGQTMNDGDRFTHYVKQAVVLYPLVDRAASF